MNRATISPLRAWVWVGVVVACACLTSPARAAFHLWEIQEIYTDSSGTLQFIELFDSASFDYFTAGQSISVSNIGNTQTNTFNLPSNMPDSTNRHILLATAGVDAAGGPTPDFIIPNNFLFAAGGTINFFGQNSGPYTALPTDGTLARLWNGGNAVNSPTAWNGTTGQVVVPEPAAFGLFTGGAVILGLLRRRALRSRAG